MTSINKLTQNPTVNTDDLMVIWDVDNQRTRSITAETLQTLLDSSGVNKNAFVSGKIESGILIMISAAGDEVVIGPVSAPSVTAEENELTTYDAATHSFIGTGVFADKGELTINTNSLNLEEAWTISSGGESIALENRAKNEFGRVHSSSFTDIGNPNSKVNRLSTGPVVPTPTDTGLVVNPDYQQVIPSFLDPPEDGQGVSYVDLKVDATSITTNISINIYLNGEKYIGTTYATLPDEISEGIRRFVYANPIDVEVGDTFRSTILSTDGDVVLKGDASTGVPYQGVTVIAWDYKRVGVEEKDASALETDFTSSVLTTKITLNDGTELTDTSTISALAGEVEVDGNASALIVTGEHLGSTYDESTKTTTINVTPSDEVIFDASSSAQFEVHGQGAGKTYKIIASGSSIVGVATVMVGDFTEFEIGALVTFIVDKSYIEFAHYAVIDTQNANLTTSRRYLNSAITLKKSQEEWYQVSSADYLNAGIGGLSEFSLGSVLNGDIQPVKALIYTTDPAVEFESQEGGTAIKVDLTLKQDAETSVNFDADIENVDFSDADLNNAGTITATDIILDNASIDSSGDITANSMVLANAVINTSGDIAANSLSIPNTNNIDLGTTSLRSYQNTTMICEADEWQWKDIAGSHTATINDTGLDLASSELKSVTDIAIDNSGTTSIYSQHHSQQSINFFNMGGLSFGADGGESIDFGFNGSVVQKLTSSSLDMGSTNVTNLSDGDADSDAATVGQSITIGDLSNPYYFDGQEKELQNVGNITLSNSGTYADIGYKNANSHIRMFNSDSIYLTIGTATYASFDIFSSAVQKYSFSNDDFDMMNKPIVNVSNGQYGTDAVNYSQLMTYQTGNTPYKVDSIAMGAGMVAQLNYNNQLTINAGSSVGEVSLSATELTKDFELSDLQHDNDGYIDLTVSITGDGESLKTDSIIKNSNGVISFEKRTTSGYDFGISASYNEADSIVSGKPIITLVRPTANGTALTVKFNAMVHV